MSAVDISQIGLNRSLVDIADERKLSQQLKEACSRQGYCLIKGHGLSQDLVDQLTEDALGFFEKMTVEQKEAASPRDVPNGQGYLATGKEALNTGAKEIKELFDVASLNPDQDIFPDSTHPSLKPNIIALGQQLKLLGERISRILAIALNREPEFFKPLHENIFTPQKNIGSRLRLAYYPPVEGMYIY